MVKVSPKDEFMPTHFEWRLRMWARWSAVDIDGEMYFYENKPSSNGTMWFPINGRSAKGGRASVNFDFKSTLRHRPKGI